MTWHEHVRDMLVMLAAIVGWLCVLLVLNPPRSSACVSGEHEHCSGAPCWCWCHVPRARIGLALLLIPWSVVFLGVSVLLKAVGK